jgi:hypothetical protein
MLASNAARKKSSASRAQEEEGHIASNKKWRAILHPVFVGLHAVPTRPERVFSAENKGPKMYDTSFALELCTAAQNVP